MTTSPDRAAASPRYFFLHLQKTGGTALWQRLTDAFEPAALYPGPGDGDPPRSTLDVAHLLDRWPTRRRDVRILTGHFPLCTTELLGDEFLVFTALRDPVERVLSALRDQQARAPEVRGRPLVEIYEDPLRRRLLDNHMAKMLAMTVDDMTDGALTEIDVDAALLDRASRRLDALAVVGVQEHFDEFCAELEARFGWQLGPPRYANRTRPVPVDPGLRRRIESGNAADRALYEQALQRRP